MRHRRNELVERRGIEREVAAQLLRRLPEEVAGRVAATLSLTDKIFFDNPKLLYPLH